MNESKDNKQRSCSLYRHIRDIFTPIYTFFFIKIFRLAPINNRKIVITSYYGKGYGDNGKYIANELLKQNKYVIIWACKKQFRHSLPGGIRYTRYYSPSYFYHLATAKVWINNARFLNGMSKRKKQFYIQVWHGDVGFKRIEADAEQALPKSYIREAKNDSKMINLMTSGSGIFTMLCHNSFWYNGEVLESGSPRNDIFFDSNSCKKIYNRIRKTLGFRSTDKILLYAPTFRSDESMGAYNIDFRRVLGALQKKIGGDWKIVVRLHPNIAKKSKSLDIWCKDVIDATNYPDSQELLIASDIIITDYSSIAFDFSLLGRPVFLYATDYDAYCKDRSFYHDYFNLPFPAAKNNDQLCKNIMNYSRKDYANKLKGFLKNTIQSKEAGKASEAIAKRIMEELDVAQGK